ncbi:MAG: hypothetical protein JWL59_3114 [Chthoniobacteraceae bacterium]|nr:hypothetical protein [Chthoniobacteraceae bacterium]
MNVKDAAISLKKALQGASWLASIGVGRDQGQDCIFVYVKRMPPKDVPEIQAARHEYPVLVRKMAAFRPLHAA